MAGTWTYNRGGESVEIHHIEQGDKAELVVTGLGLTSRREFTSLEETLHYLITLEGSLVAAGWSFRHFRPERRRGEDRRASWRSAPDRRRPGPMPSVPTQAAP